MIILGIGCAPNLITMEAAKTIWDAKRVAGSEKALDMVGEYIQEGCRVYVLRDYFKLEEFPPDTVVLSTGDPMLVGLRAEGAEYVPGISSMQLAFARLKLPLESVAVVVAQGKYHHTKAVDEVVREAKRGKNVFVMIDRKFDLPGLAAKLREKKVGCRIAACQDLGYAEESILLGSSEEPPSPTSDLCALVVGSW